MGAVDAIIGGIFGLGGSQLSSAQQFSRQKHFAQNRYQYAVGDLKKAGLNPMLAVGQSQPLSQASTHDSGKAGAAGVAAGTQVGMARAQTDLLRAQTAKTEAETPKVQTEAKVFNKINDLIDQYGPKVEAYLRRELPKLGGSIHEAGSALGSMKIPSADDLVDAITKKVQRQFGKPPKKIPTTTRKQRNKATHQTPGGPASRYTRP